jgi:hypothetical protein
MDDERIVQRVGHGCSTLPGSPAARDGADRRADLCDDRFGLSSPLEHRGYLALAGKTVKSAHRLVITTWRTPFTASSAESPARRSSPSPASLAEEIRRVAAPGRAPS